MFLKKKVFRVKILVFYFLYKERKKSFTETKCFRTETNLWVLPPKKKRKNEKEKNKKKER